VNEYRDNSRSSGCDAGDSGSGAPYGAQGCGITVADIQLAIRDAHDTDSTEPRFMRVGVATARFATWSARRTTPHEVKAGLRLAHAQCPPRASRSPVEGL
jgi:hypothetical protein